MIPFHTVGRGYFQILWVFLCPFSSNGILWCHKYKTLKHFQGHLTPKYIQKYCVCLFQTIHFFDLIKKQQQKQTKTHQQTSRNRLYHCYSVFHWFLHLWSVHKLV